MFGWLKKKCRKWRQNVCGLSQMDRLEHLVTELSCLEVQMARSAEHLRADLTLEPALAEYQEHYPPAPKPEKK